MACCTLAYSAHSSSVVGITVLMNVKSSCSVANASLIFPPYVDSTKNVDGMTNLVVTCTNTTPYKVGLDAGTGLGASINSRKMSNGSNQLSYNLYQDSARTVTWGDAYDSSSGCSNRDDSNFISMVGTGLSQSIPVYGRVFANQRPNPGVYNDNVTITIYL